MNDPGTDNRVFNIGSGENYSVKEIYQMFTELLNIKISPVFKPDLPGEAQETLADITQAKLLKWYPKTDIKTGLKEMVKYIKNEIKMGRVKL
jgi:nucleoside-diphosphate-sugar epimerase